MAIRKNGILMVYVVTLLANLTVLFAQNVPANKKAKFDSVFYNSIIENGFPAKTLHSPGGGVAGPGINVLLSDINGDSFPEMIFTGISSGPIYCFDRNGNLVPGWPVSLTGGGVGYSVSYHGLVCIGTCNAPGYIAGFNATGTKLWEKMVNYVGCPGSIIEVGPETMMVFIEQEDWYLHGYNLYDGSILPNWPVMIQKSQELHTPAIADINVDGFSEVITCSGTGNDKYRITALCLNGDIVPGWDSIDVCGESHAFPAIGDVDNDNTLEIITISEDTISPWTNYCVLFTPEGFLKRNFQITGTMFLGTAPALADIDGDKRPDIIIQTDTHLNVTNGFGEALPGWPKELIGGWAGNSSPVVGDVDGDNNPEILTTSQEAGSAEIGYVHCLKATGEYLPGFPMLMNIGAGAVPAIADFDGDNHNELIIMGDAWDGITPMYDALWVFDLDRDSVGVIHGKIEWGQFMHDERHSGYYGAPTTGVTGDKKPFTAPGLSLVCWPNPFKTSATIRYNCATPTKTVVGIYDIAGRLVERLFEGRLEPGMHTWKWNGQLRNTGVYFCRVSAGNSSSVIKLIHLK